MTMTRVKTSVILACLWHSAMAGTATAQSSDSGGTRPLSFDTVIGVQDVHRETVAWPTQVIIDSSATWQVSDKVFASVRPVLWRVDGTWQTLINQASLRYEAGRETRVRLELGRFVSPIGLGMTENRANVNPGVLWCHRLYYESLPSLGPDVDEQALVAAVYPVGAMGTVTSSKWDARVAVLDRAPTTQWTRPTRLVAPKHLVVGGGLSPRQGLRVGVAAARGALEDRGRERSTYQMLNVETDWAFAYTRISGEWTHDRFDTALGARTANGVTAQLRQTLTPRLFVHTRATRARAPEVAAAGDVRLRDFRAVDSTVGYLVSPELTVRVGHTALKSWTRPATDHQLTVSVVWAKRWW